MRESRIERECVKMLLKYGWDDIKVHKNGYPDRMFFRGNTCFFIEFKRDSKSKLSLIQEVVHSEMAQKGMAVFIVYDKKQILEEVFPWIKEHSMTSKKG